MFSGFEEFNISVASDVTIHGVKGGSGSPLLLLHGFPQNLNIWYRVAEPLSQKFTVVALDLRGYGKSSKPESDEKHVAYSKTVMARDCVITMKKLGFEKFFLCGHDRGARVAHRMCVDYPELVIKAILLDICPTLATYRKTDFEFAKIYAHWFFLIKPYPFPEKLITADPRAFAEGHMGKRGDGGGLAIFAPECFESYVVGLADPHAVHAMCEDYRASASIDMEEAERDIKEGKNIQCPLVVLWGKRGVIERKFDALKEWKEVSDATVEGGSVDSGHYIPEEAPQELLAWIEKFMG